MPSLAECLAKSLSEKPGKSWNQGDVEYIKANGGKKAIKELINDAKRQLQAAEAMLAVKASPAVKQPNWEKGMKAAAECIAKNIA